MNKNVLAARLERLREYIHNLEAVQQFDCKRFIEDPFIHGMAERNLHLAIEQNLLSCRTCWDFCRSALTQFTYATDRQNWNPWMVQKRTEVM